MVHCVFLSKHIVICCYFYHYSFVQPWNQKMSPKKRMSYYVSLIRGRQVLGWGRYGRKQRFLFPLIFENIHTKGDFKEGKNLGSHRMVDFEEPIGIPYAFLTNV